LKLTKAQSEKRKVKSESAKRKRVLTPLSPIRWGPEKCPWNPPNCIAGWTVRETRWKRYKVIKLNDKGFVESSRKVYANLFAYMQYLALLNGWLTTDGQNWKRSWATARCSMHEQRLSQSWQLWLRSVINLGWSRPPLSLLQSSFLPFPLVDSPGDLGRACSPAAKHFDAIYTVKQPYKIHTDVPCTTCDAACLAW